MAQDFKDILKERARRQERASRPEINWFTLKDRKLPVYMQFLQELSEDSPRYSKEKGKVVFLTEHVSPHDFRMRAQCTLEDEGHCWACEMNIQEPELTVAGEKKNKPWAQKTNLYTYVVDSEGKVFVLSRSAYSTFADKVFDFNADEGEGSITGITFKINKGPTRNASWDLSTTKNEIDVPEIGELADLESLVSRKVPYAEQKKFYLPNKPINEDVPADPNPRDRVSNTSDSIDW